MKNSSKKKKLLAVAAALAIIAVLSGTFAWLTAQDQRINRASASKVSDDSVSIIEEWEPIDLVAGTSAKKEVSITNSGEANVFVRLSYEEVLKHLQDAEKKFAPSTTAGVKYTYVANDPGLDKHMPVNTNVDKALKDGFVYVPESQVTGLEAGTKLFARGTRKFDNLTQKYHTNYELKIVHEYYTDPANSGLNPGDTGYDASKNLYQTMTLDHDVDDYNSNSENASEWDYTVSNLQYGYYDKGYKNTVANWAKSSLADRAGNLTGNALLGTSGKRHTVDYDYTTTALGLTSIPIPSPVTAADQIPSTPLTATENGVQADLLGFGENKIRIKYGTDMTNIASLDSDKWVYNKDDGWFYYTSPLISGTTTPNLLTNLVFSSSMGSEYDNASYDLIVKMEAIQATKEALTDSAGWNLGGGSTPTGDTLAIVNKLAP